MPPAHTGEETVGSLSSGGVFDHATFASLPVVSSATTLPELNAPSAEMQTTLPATEGEPT